MHTHSVTMEFVWIMEAQKYPLSIAAVSIEEKCQATAHVTFM